MKKKKIIINKFNSMHNIIIYKILVIDYYLLVEKYPGEEMYV